MWSILIGQTKGTMCPIFGVFMRPVQRWSKISALGCVNSCHIPSLWPLGQVHGTYSLFEGMCVAYVSLCGGMARHARATCFKEVGRDRGRAEQSSVWMKQRKSEERLTGTSPDSSRLKSVRSARPRKEGRRKEEGRGKDKEINVRRLRKKGRRIKSSLLALGRSWHSEIGSRATCLSVLELKYVWTLEPILCWSWALLRNVATWWKYFCLVLKVQTSRLPGMF